MRRDPKDEMLEELQRTSLRKREMLDPREQELRRRESEDLDDMLKESTGGEEQLEGRGNGQPAPVKIEFDMKPKDVKEYLDRYVIKQDQAKKFLANAICYHYGRIKKAQETKEAAIEAQKAAEAEAKKLGKKTDGKDKKPAVPANGTSDAFIKKNVLLIGSTGVGKTYLVQKLSKLLGVPFVKEDATKFSATGYVGRNVEDMARDLYLAADKNKELAQYGIIYIDEIDKVKKEFTIGKDVNGVEVQRGLLKLMEDTDVELISNEDPFTAMGAMKEMKQNGNGKAGRPSMSTKHVLFILAGAFPGLEDIVKRRLAKEEKAGAYDASESKDAYVGTWHNKLIAQDVIEYGFEPEFVGRIPIRVGLEDLNADDLYQILTKSQDSVLQQYKNDFDSYDIKVEFADEALRAFAEKAAKEKTGARALVGVIEETMLDYMYELPSTDVKELVVTAEMVKNPRKALAGIVMDGSLESFTKKVYDESGITMTFDKKAKEYLSERFLKSGANPSDICTPIVGKYTHALKLYGQDKFIITDAVLKNPEGYLKTMLRSYSESKEEKPAARAR